MFRCYVFTKEIGDITLKSNRFLLNLTAKYKITWVYNSAISKVYKWRRVKVHTAKSLNPYLILRTLTFHQWFVSSHLTDISQKSVRHRHSIFGIKEMILIYIPYDDLFSPIFISTANVEAMSSIVLLGLDFEFKCVKLLDCNQDDFWRLSNLLHSSFGSESSVIRLCLGLLCPV